ncbi:MAG: cupin domain-containing protein [Pseudomonadota bacterium]
MENFYNIEDESKGTPRKLAEGISARIFPGEQAMISIVRIEPNAMGTLHHHPEEQWGFMVEGSATRFQGDEEIETKAGDFWRTPSNVPHTIKAGPEGAVIFDIFAPPREAYLKPGEGFGTN